MTDNVYLLLFAEIQYMIYEICKHDKSYVFINILEFTKVEYLLNAMNTM